MQRRFRVGAAFGACVFLTAMVAVYGQRASPTRRVVLTEKEAVLVLGAEMVAGPEVYQTHPCPEGRYLLALRRQEEPTLLASPPNQQPPAEQSLLLWNSRTRRTHVLWRQREQSPGVRDVAWLPGTDIAFIAATTTLSDGKQRQNLLLVDASRAAIRPIAPLEDGDALTVSAAHPLAALLNSKQGTLRLIRTNGSIGPPLTVPRSAFATGVWSEDGAALYLNSIDFSDTPGARPVRRWYAVNPRTGAVTKLPEPPKRTKPDAALAERTAALSVRLKTTTATVKEETTTQTLRPLWLESVAASAKPRALIAPDSQTSLLLPDGSAAVYVAQGALYAAPLSRMALAEYTAAQRDIILQNAKQIGVALMMYTQDYDEALPLGGEGITDRLGPYLRNSAVFDNPLGEGPGFFYTYPGGPRGAITAPADTALGYLVGPGGRAVLYADGHIQWRDD